MVGADVMSYSFGSESEAEGRDKQNFYGGTSGINQGSSVILAT